MSEPAKYKGKSREEVIKMHMELERLMGRKSGELGELRKAYLELSQDLAITVKELELERNQRYK